MEWGNWSYKFESSILKELTNSLYLLNLSYINPRSYLSIILRVSSIEALVKPNEISEELSKYIDDVGKGINEIKLKDTIKIASKVELETLSMNL